MSAGPEKYVLYAEDDPDDQLLMREVLSIVDSTVHLITCEHGKEAFEYLNELPEDAYLPCLIILDLNMPVWDGMETLRALKSEPRFLHLPVLLFSTTNNDSDRNLALELGAVSFVTKPTTYRNLEIIIASFKAYFSGC
jgi:CheY-like chemotaxis protein